jgi:hypothetical protein
VLESKVILSEVGILELLMSLLFVVIALDITVGIAVF